MNQYESLAGIILRPHLCDKYSSCNANICPLDPDWRDRTYIKGEAICFYLLETQKPGAALHFQGTIEVLTLEVIDEIIEPLKCMHSPLKKRLELAYETRSRRAKR